MIVKQPHWCPACRIMLSEWRIPGSGLKNKKLTPGDPWPLREPFKSEAIDVCPDCGREMKGQIVVHIDENGETDLLVGVKEFEI